MNVQTRIEEKLSVSFSPQSLEVSNESHRHNVPPGAESHFKVVIVSEEFVGMSLLERHRAINTALAAELAGSVHALAIHAFTPQEWQARGQSAQSSPPCLGGEKPHRLQDDDALGQAKTQAVPAGDSRSL